jgi:YidC/Oxa1 family membrane protein insertase
MDNKRLLVAFTLAILVTLAINYLFPAPKRPPAPAARDTAAATGAAAPAQPGSRAPGDTAVAPPTAPRAATAGGAAISSDSLRMAARVPVETTTVATPRAVFHFTNVGAVLGSAEMRGFRSLRRGDSGQPVRLARPGERLVAYQLVAGRDTVRLDTVAFERAVPRPAVAVARGAVPPVAYAATLPGGGRVAITYTFAPDSYLVRVRGDVEGVAQPAYLLVDLPSGLRSSEADTVDDQRHLAYAFKPQREGAKIVRFSDLDPGESRLAPGPLTWVVAKSKYFLVALLTPPNEPAFSELSVTGGPRTSKIASTARGRAVRPVTNGGFAFELYAGPQEWRRLHALGRDLENANPYGSWLQGIVQPFATIVMRIVLWMKDTTRLNYGWVLIIFGVAVRFALWPLNQNAMRQSLKLQRIQPQIQEIQKRYRNDPQKLQTEMMRVYQEHGMSPFSTFSGCLPMLLPMPVLFALFFVFQNTIEFRGVPFLWLPDISLKDPYYVVPILMGLTMFALSWIGMRSAPPNPQAKMMAYVLPVTMTFIFLNMASGLNLYYAVQNLAAIPQQLLIARERAKSGGPGAGAGAGGGARSEVGAARAEGRGSRAEKKAKQGKSA